MAEGKKSFIVYSDWKRYIDVLTDEQVGKWTRWMFDYCNDKWENTEIEYPEDVSVRMLCIMTKDTLKRDLTKYKAKKKRIDEINERKRIEAEMKSNKNKNDMDNEIAHDIDNEVGQCNMLNVKCNMLNEVSKDTNNNILSISKDISNITSEPKKSALELPTVKGNKGSSYPIYQDQIDKWQSVYVGIDVFIELNKMIAWLEANPKNKKTYQGTPRFIINWLSRQQDRASRNGVSITPSNQDEIIEVDGKKFYKSTGMEIL